MLHVSDLKDCAGSDRKHNRLNQVSAVYAIANGCPSRGGMNGTAETDYFQSETMNSEQLRSIYVQQAVKAESGANRETWRSCLWCSRVVGRYEKSAVLGLADDLGKSTDTVYDRAHAYFIFEDLCKHRNGTYRKLVFIARRSPYIYWSHFRALWDARRSYELSMEQVFDLLMDIIQAEGGISSRSLDSHVHQRYGKDKHWTYYTSKAKRELEKAIASGGVPRRLRKNFKKILSQIEKNQ